MSEWTEILVGILILIYGIMFYIIGRTNFLEKVIIGKLNKFLKSIEENDQEKGGAE